MLNPTWPRNDHHLQINPTCPDQSSTHQATMLGCNLGLVKLCMCHKPHHLLINFAYPRQGSTHKATRLGCNLVLILTLWCTFRYVHRQCSCPISYETDYVSPICSPWPLMASWRTEAFPRPENAGLLGWALKYAAADEASPLPLTFGVC